jgi:hypothetical protein
VFSCYSPAQVIVYCDVYFDMHGVWCVLCYVYYDVYFYVHSVF